MLFEKYPFFDTSVSKMLNMIAFSDLRLNKDDEISYDPEAIRILKGLLQKDPDSRISIENIKQSPWFTSTVTAHEYSALNTSVKLINRNKLAEEALDDGLDEHYVVNKEAMMRMLHRRVLNDEMAKVLKGVNKKVYCKPNRLQTDFGAFSKANHKRIVKYPSLIKPKMHKHLIINPPLW